MTRHMIDDASHDWWRMIMSSVGSDKIDPLWQGKSLKISSQSDLVKCPQLSEGLCILYVVEAPKTELRYIGYILKIMLLVF